MIGEKLSYSRIKSEKRGRKFKLRQIFDSQSFPAIDSAKTHEIVQKTILCREQFGEIFSFLLAGKQVTVLTGLQGNEAFFKASDDRLSAKEAYQFMTPILGKGIAYDVSPELMNEQLEFVFPALKEERMQTYASLMKAEAETYFAAWQDEGEIDLLAAMNELTIFIASNCLIGEEFRQNVTTEFAQLYHDLEGGVNLIAFFFPNLPLPSLIN